MASGYNAIYIGNEFVPMSVCSYVINLYSLSDRLSTPELLHSEWVMSYKLPVRAAKVASTIHTRKERQGQQLGIVLRSRGTQSELKELTQ